MGGPSGYALSQPISAGMYAGGGGGGSRHNSGSFGSVDRKARPHFVDRHATLNENDLDPCEEDEEEGKGASRGRSSPFKRDYRTKSIYGDGVVFGKWMERLDNCDMVRVWWAGSAGSRWGRGCRTGCGVSHCAKL